MCSALLKLSPRHLTPASADLYFQIDQNELYDPKGPKNII